MPYRNSEGGSEILIFKADKGGAVVVMDHTHYTN